MMMTHKHSGCLSRLLALGLVGLTLAGTSGAVPLTAASAGHAVAANPVGPAPAEAQLNDDRALPAPDLAPYLGELEKLKRTQRENLEIKQQIEQDQLRAQLATLRGQQLGEGASPYVLALTGAGKQRQARVMVPGFGELTVQAGDALPNGWTIVAVNDHVVLASQGNDARVQLPFYAPR
jgi:hypothetical protein